MSELRKTYAGALFYLTFTVVGWADVFTRKIYTDELVKNLIYCQESKKRRTILFEWIRDFKSHTAKKLLSIILENPQE